MTVVAVARKLEQSDDPMARRAVARTARRQLSALQPARSSSTAAKTALAVSKRRAEEVFIMKRINWKSGQTVTTKSNLCSPHIRM